MLLIVITTIGSLALAAHGWPGNGVAAWTVLGMALVSGGSSAINHWYDRDIDALMERTSARPVASGRVPPIAALGLGLVLVGGRHGAARRRGALARGLLGAGRLPLLRARLHRLAQAPDAAEHRHRRGRGRGAAARRLGRGRRLGDRHGGRALRDRVPLDAAPLLVARAPARRGLRPRRRADAADGARRRGERAPDPRLHRAARRVLARARRAGDAELAVRDRGRAARRPLHLARAAPSAGAQRPRDRTADVPLLAALPRPAVRRHGHRQRAPRARRLRPRGARAR